ncbi:MAG: hypothetical protein ACI93H_000857 [Psychromonas sp.]|jgi:hypothetical protein
MKMNIVNLLLAVSSLMIQVKMVVLLKNQRSAATSEKLGDGFRY